MVALLRTNEPAGGGAGLCLRTSMALGTRRFPELYGLGTDMATAVARNAKEPRHLGMRATDYASGGAFKAGVIAAVVPPSGWQIHTSYFCSSSPPISASRCVTAPSR